MTPKLFVEGGYQWSAVPPISMLPWSRARHLWEHLVESVHDSGERVALFTRRIAQSLGVSMRYVQYAIRDLIDLGFVTVRDEREVLPDGRVMIRRVMTLIQRPAGKPPKPKRPAGLATKPASKIFSPVDERSFVDPRTDVRRPLLFEEESKREDSQAPGGGESDGTDPPPGLEVAATDPAEAEARDAAALAAFVAQFADPPPPPAPARTPTAAPERSAQVRPAVATSENLRERTERLAASGDPIAQAELDRMNRARDRGPAPPSAPPPSPPLRPRSEPKRASPLSPGKSLVAWLRKLIE